MSLKAELRTQTGTAAARKDRNAGLIPVTLYGKAGFETLSLTVNRREFEALLKKEGSNAVFNVEFDGKTQKVWIKDFAKAALADEFYSLDLEAISADQKLQVEVPLYLLNEESVKEGVIEQIENTILVETTPDNIPASFEIDLTGAVVGDVKTIADIVVPADVEVLDEADRTIITISAPTEEPEETDGDAEVAEPEVIGAKPEEEA